MSVNIETAEHFVLANARVLDRHRLATLLHRDPPEPVLRALRAYQNQDGGFGHALEPDIRDNESQPAAVLHALEVLAEVGALHDPMVTDAARWVADSALPDGSVPFVRSGRSGAPRAPWMMQASSAVGSFLTFAISGLLWEAGYRSSWLDTATEWCWDQLERQTDLDGYWVKFALAFLDRVPESDRARVAIGGLRTHLRPDGTIPVQGGIEGEQLTPLALSGRPDGVSRTLFPNELIASDLDRIEEGQLDDGGWDFEFLHWSAGQTVEWRGISTVLALTTLAANGRLQVATPPQQPG